MLNEVTISKAIITTYMEKLLDALELDVAIVGAGPSGLVAGYYLAGAGKKAAVFEKKLSIGGGMWGGGMMFNEIVIQQEAREVLDELGIPVKTFEPGYYTADSIDAVSTLIHRAVRRGLKIFNCISVEDVVFKKDRISGLVINYSPVETAGLHVDPLTLHSSFVLDATGHPANVVRCLVRKMGVKLDTPTGGIMGERSMDAGLGEAHTVENTREVFPGLFVSGMAANESYGGYRMGPVFGGMLLSGRKAAREMIGRLSS
ncbi:MAG: thiazole biosynthesis protein [Bacteriovoracaceae bacterium]|jgi:thiamine thiazole synthase|nr:thiazole biosynthesis protein [Deltaproteobacteria bacterium]MDI9541338.1 sulfide-dependent adenosine diphosphate thiazole synthase [Pseudomonadota bacterium]NLW68117.1 thiazole biosynthesis protein [Bacteriovoracaceae bacterium]HRR20860.1 sulfide-dependent adenosine diphosphate thiazole synthase [Desulfomonilia bacterium]HNR50435.1 sulfide-dependent adenosine diphosphate thiazole synthase [Deltaproteobacteria bacterium]